MPADLLGAELIDGNATDADVFARSFANRKARQEIGGLGIMTVALVTVFFVEVREDKEILFVRSERIERNDTVAAVQSAKIGRSVAHRSASGWE